MGDLTANLSRSEMACSCECGCDTMDWETVFVVQDVCDHFGCKVLVKSAHRCFRYNRIPVAEGGPGSNDNSQHPLGRALDGKFSKVEPAAVHHYLCEKYPGRFGFGLYSWGNHIDTRTDGPARWDTTQ